MSARKIYLGDGVYADIERGMIVLTTESGPGPTNTIYLELQVYEALVAWVKRIQTEAIFKSLSTLYPEPPTPNTSFYDKQT